MCHDRDYRSADEPDSRARRDPTRPQVRRYGPARNEGSGVQTAVPFEPPHTNHSSAAERGRDVGSTGHDPWRRSGSTASADSTAGRVLLAQDPYRWAQGDAVSPCASTLRTTVIAMTPSTVPMAVSASSDSKAMRAKMIEARADRTSR